MAVTVAWAATYAGALLVVDRLVPFTPAFGHWQFDWLPFAGSLSRLARALFGGRWGRKLT